MPIRIAGPYVDLGLATDKFNSGLSMASLQIAKFGLTNTRALKALATQVGVTVSQLEKLNATDIGRISGGITRSVASSIRVFALAGVGAYGLAKAIGAAREQIEQMVAIADKARDVGIGGNFFQRFSAESQRLQVSASELESALSHAFQATQEKSPINLAEWETGKEKITEVEKALRVYQATGTKLEGLVLFRDARNQEQKIMAVLKAMTELEAAGRKLESLQLGELMFGKNFVDSIRLGKTSAEQLLETMRLTGQAATGIFSDEMISRAKEVDSNLKMAQNTLSREMQPTMEILARQVLSMKSDWAAIVGHAAAAFRWINQIDLTAKRDELAQVEKALENKTGLYGLPRLGDSDRIQADLMARKARLQSEIDNLEGRVRPSVTVTPSRGSGATPTRNEATSASSDADAFTRAADAIARRTAMLQADVAAIGMSESARARLRIEAELTTAAIQKNRDEGKANTEVTEEQAQKIRVLADAYGAAAQRMEQARSPMQAWIRESKDLNARFQEFGAGALGGISDGLADIVTGAKSAKDGFKDLADSILKDLTRLLIRRALAGFVGAMFGDGGGGMGGGGGGVSLFSFNFGGGGSRYADGGLVRPPLVTSIARQFASGGMISGPGGPRSDSILAALSNGEYVVNAAATKKNRGLLEAINGGLSLSAPMLAFADGGPVGMTAMPETCLVGKIGGSNIRVYH